VSLKMTPDTVAKREISPWEQAYLEFETPEEEVNKFRKRLISFGALSWPRDVEIVELFCGRGNGLVALERLGFTRLEGIDLSPALLAQYKGLARCVVGDCRQMPFAAHSKDILIVQGGLHHLPDLPGDLEQTLCEARRVLRSDGRLIVVEPWRTPFLDFVHFVSERAVARAAWSKIRAFATMTEHEQTTYEQWLNNPQQILDCFQRFFTIHSLRIHYGKLMLEGRPQAGRDAK